MAKKLKEDVAGAKRLMAALVRMPPKPHEQMKAVKTKASRRKENHTDKKD